MEKKEISFTPLQLHKSIEAIGRYRHDNREYIKNADEMVLKKIEDKMIEKYREIKPNFIPFY